MHLRSLENQCVHPSGTEHSRKKVCFVTSPLIPLIDFLEEIPRGMHVQ